MSLLPRAALGLGLLLLAHAAYSAHEHSALLALHQPLSSPSSSPLSSSSLPSLNTSALLTTLLSPSSSPSSPSLPLDITIEVLLSLALLLPSLTFMIGSASPLQPIRHREYAAAVDHGVFRKMRLEKAARGKVVLQGPGHEEGYGWLEKGRRAGFVDVRGMREGFAEFVRGRSDGE